MMIIYVHTNLMCTIRDITERLKCIISINKENNSIDTFWIRWSKIKIKVSNRNKKKRKKYLRRKNVSLNLIKFHLNILKFVGTTNHKL